MVNNKPDTELSNHSKAIFDAIGEGVFVVDLLGTVTSINSAALKILGYEAGEVIGKQMHDVLQHSSQKGVVIAHEECRVYAAYREGKAYHVFDEFFWRKDGTNFPVAYISAPLAESGKIIGAVAVFHDIATQKISEKNEEDLQLRMEQQVHFMRSLKNLASIITSTDDAQVIIENVASIIGETLGTDRCLVYNIDFVRQEIIGLSEWLNPEAAPIVPTKATYPMKVFATCAKQMAETKTPVESHFDKAALCILDDGSDKVLHEQMNIKSLLWYPFAFRPDGYYLLAFNQVRKRREWQKEELQFIDAATKDVAFAIQKINLIAEERKMQNQLQKNSELLEEIFASIGVLLAYMDKNFTFIKVNDAYAAADGHTPDYYVGKNHFKLFPNLENEAIFKKVIETGESAIHHAKAFEYAEQPERGVSYWDWRVEPVKSTDGKVEGLILSLINVTQEIVAVQKIKLASEYARNLIETSLDPLVTISPDGKVTDVNKATEEITGISRDNLIGADFSKYFIDPKKAYEGYQKVLTEGFVKDYPLSFRHVSGKVTDVLYNAAVYRNSKGEVQGVFAAARDITKQKQAEQSLKKTAASLKEAQRIALLGSWELDLVKNILTWSDEIYRIFEIDPEKFGATYEAFLNTIHPDDRSAVDQAYTNSLKMRKPYFIDHRLLFSDGRIKYVHERCETFYDKDGKPLYSVGTVQDITEAYIAQSRVRDLAKLQNTFIEVVSHQLRTPLNAIRWNLESLLAGNLGTFSKEQQEFIRLTHDANTKIIAILHDLLVAIDMEEGRVVVNKVEFSFESLWGSVFIEWNKKYVVKGLDLVLKVEKMPQKVLVDTEKIRYVMSNLVENAADYTPKGGTIVVMINQVDDKIRFEVLDNGMGIPKAEQPNIFNRFYRAYNAVSMKPDGSGLGLAIAKYYIEQHGGKIGFTSEEGKGSTFWFEIPIK